MRNTLTKASEYEAWGQHVGGGLFVYLLSFLWRYIVLSNFSSSARFSQSIISSGAGLWLCPGLPSPPQHPVRQRCCSPGATSPFLSLVGASGLVLSEVMEKQWNLVCIFLDTCFVKMLPSRIIKHAGTHPSLSWREALSWNSTVLDQGSIPIGANSLRAGFSVACGSLPTQNIPWFCESYSLIFLRSNSSSLCSNVNGKQSIPLSGFWKCLRVAKPAEVPLPHFLCASQQCSLSSWNFIFSTSVLQSM